MRFLKSSSSLLVIIALFTAQTISGAHLARLNAHRTSLSQESTRESVRRHMRSFTNELAQAIMDPVEEMIANELDTNALALINDHFEGDSEKGSAFLESEVNSKAVAAQRAKFFSWIKKKILNNPVVKKVLDAVKPQVKKWFFLIVGEVLPKLEQNLAHIMKTSMSPKTYGILIPPTLGLINKLEEAANVDVPDDIFDPSTSSREEDQMAKESSEKQQEHEAEEEAEEEAQEEYY